MSCQVGAPVQPLTAGAAEPAWPSRPSSHLARGLLACRSFDPRPPPFHSCHASHDGVIYHPQRVAEQQHRRLCPSGATHHGCQSPPPCSHVAAPGHAYQRLASDAVGCRGAEPAAVLHGGPAHPNVSSSAAPHKERLPIGTAVAGNGGRSRDCPASPSAPSSVFPDAMVGVERPGLSDWAMSGDGEAGPADTATAQRTPAPAPLEPCLAAPPPAAGGMAAAAEAVASSLRVDCGGFGSGDGPWRDPGPASGWRRVAVGCGGGEGGGGGASPGGAEVEEARRLPPALRDRPSSALQHQRVCQDHREAQQHHRGAGIQRRGASEAGCASDSEAGRRGCGAAAAGCRVSALGLDGEAAFTALPSLQHASLAFEGLDVGERLTLRSVVTHGSSAWPGTAPASPVRVRLVRQRSVGLTRKRVLV